MTAALPPPLIPADVDLRNFGFMPLDVVRLRDSDLVTVSTAAEFRAAVLLWCASWHQLPAGSLPDDDQVLAKLAQSARRWKSLKLGALRGFVRCADGRLYHPVICEKALESWDKKQKNLAKTRAATAARHRDVDRHGQRDGDRNVDRHGQRDGDQGIGEGQGKDTKATEHARVRVRAVSGSNGHEPEPSPSGEKAPGPDDRWQAFELIKAEYPRNPHNAVAWGIAEREIGRRFDEGVTFETLFANTIAYREQQRALGKVGSQYIYSPKTFYAGERGPWRGPFDVPDDEQPADVKSITWKPGDPNP